MNESRLAYSKTGYLKPAKVEELKQQDNKMTFKPHVSENSKMIDNIQTQRLLNEASMIRGDRHEEGNLNEDPKLANLKTLDRLISDFRQFDKTFKKEGTSYNAQNENLEEDNVSERTESKSEKVDRADILFRRQEKRKQWQVENEERKKQEVLDFSNFTL